MFLVIDTALEKAYVLLVQSAAHFFVRENTHARDHARFVPTAIEELCREAKTELSQLQGVVVVNGPGSYTGLRVGLSSAKGICFALEKPLYTLSTLEVMAAAGWRQAAEKGINSDENTLVCPMIDARRMEVFTGLYHKNLTPARKPFALIADEVTLKELSGTGHLIFTGNGVEKLHKLLPPGAISFPGLVYEVNDLVTMSFEKLSGGSAADLAYTEPLYIKDFYQAS